MQIKNILLAVFCMFLAAQGYTQSSNSYNKSEVLTAVADLNQQTQSWIDSNFNRLTDAQIASFMRGGTMATLAKTHGQRFATLKARATEAEIESLYRDPSESRIQSLFTKYSI